MICLTARSLEDGKAIFVGYGVPQVIAILAQRLYTPDICQVYEYGAIGPQVATPFKRNMMADARNSYRAIAWMNMNCVMSQASSGLIDYGILGAAQVDRYGNINSTMIGTNHDKPKIRFTGSGGGNEVASLCWRTIIIMEHEKRRFPERVDFITSPGYLNGLPGEREEKGLPKNTGPYLLITSLALFDFKNREMRLIGLRDRVNIKDVLDNMEFKPQIAKRMKKLKSPDERELKILREEIDPERVIIGGK